MIAILLQQPSEIRIREISVAVGAAVSARRLRVTELDKEPLKLRPNWGRCDRSNDLTDRRDLGAKGCVRRLGK